MKIRTGFVSNSSSASFVITATNMKKDDILEVLSTNLGWSVYNRSQIKKELEAEISACKKRLKEKSEENPLKELHDFLEKNSLEDAQNFLEKIDEMSDNEVAERILLRCGITIFENKNNDTTLSHCVTMYNDIGDIGEAMAMMSTTLTFANINHTIGVYDDNYEESIED